MVKNNGLLRVFWPLDSIVPGISGVLVGWRNSETDILIAGILENTEVGQPESYRVIWIKWLTACECSHGLSTMLSESVDCIEAVRTP